MMTMLITLDLSSLNLLALTSPDLDSHLHLVLRLDHSLTGSAALRDQDFNFSLSLAPDIGPRIQQKVDGQQMLGKRRD